MKIFTTWPFTESANLWCNTYEQSRECSLEARAWPSCPGLLLACSSWRETSGDFFKGGCFICASVPLKTVTKAPVDSLLPFLAVPGTALSATPLSQLPRNTPPSTEPQGLESRRGQQARRSETQPLVVRTERPRQHRLSPIRQEGTLTGSIPVNFPVNSATELAGKGQNVLGLC